MSIQRTTASILSAIATFAIATSPAFAQLASTGADASPILSCFYECKPGPDIQGQSTYRQVTTLPVVNNGRANEIADVNFLDGNQNVIATTQLDLPARDVDELAVCNTIEAITGAAPPRAGVIHIGSLEATLGQRVSGVFSWIKNVNGKFFADRPEPFDGRVTGVAKSQCTYVATPEVNTPALMVADGQSAPSGPPILVEDTEDTPNDPLPDLLPVADSFTSSYCRIDPAGAGLEVEIRNQGAAPTGPTTTHVTFPGSGVIESISTPGLAAGASSTAIVPFPFGCFAPNCAFVIEADEADVEVESDEVNNVESDFCLG